MQIIKVEWSAVEGRGVQWSAVQCSGAERSGVGWGGVGWQCSGWDENGMQWYHLQLKVEFFRCAVHGGLLPISELASRSVERSATHHHRTRPSVISNGDPQPIRIKRIFFPAKHRPNVGGMFSAGIEIRVISNV